MLLQRMIYASSATEHFAPEHIKQILSSAKENNEKNNISGLLLFSQQYFLQVLEGSRELVNATYELILNDRRHHKAIILDYAPITKRDFDSWSMGFIPELAFTKEICFRYSGKDAFEPYKMSGDSALGLLLELKETLPCA